MPPKEGQLGADAGVRDILGSARLGVPGDPHSGRLYLDSITSGVLEVSEPHEGSAW